MPNLGGFEQRCGHLFFVVVCGNELNKVGTAGASRQEQGGFGFRTVGRQFGAMIGQPLCRGRLFSAYGL